ncbi:MAG TPA: right-handed parallel beta-helix repeat-containing protein [Polyangia bacterium]|nr:right-handed parallel beta-helix repeat-containing protein [Polyangia bacterium]
MSPSGRDTNPGTMAAPFATLQRANTAAAAGDTIWLRGGTYFSTTQIVLSKSGLSDAQRTRIWAYPGEVPILDCSRYLSTNKAADVPSVLVTGSWMHLKGIEIANGPVGVPGDHSISMLRTRNASNNTFELLNIHHGFGPGLFIDTGNGGNLILNCDSHDNYDKDGSQGDGQNADGFGVHYQTTGPSTIIRGCRAWLNSDDGYDLISQEVPVTVEQSWAFQNGFADGGSVSPSSGNGNGFKMGSSATGIRHIVQQNLAWKNKAAGFYANHSTGGNTWLNNTSFMNGTQFNMLASPANDPNTTITLTGALAHIMRNNIGFPDRNSNMGGVDTSFNTWDLNIAQAATDFVSTLDTGATGPRQANGSVPANGFTRLAAGSPLIDKGTNVNLPFVGRAPDLGAFEFGAVANGSGGSSGAGGAVGGVGGAAGRPDAGTTGAGTGGQGATGAGGATGGGGSPATGVGGGAATSIGGNSGGGGTAGGPGGGVDGNASGGCACGLALASPGSPWAVALSALALLALRARRRPARARRAS